MKTLLIVFILILSSCATVKEALNIDPEQVDFFDNAVDDLTARVTDKWNAALVAGDIEVTEKLAEKLKEWRKKVEQFKSDVE